MPRENRNTDIKTLYEVLRTKLDKLKTTHAQMVGQHKEKVKHLIEIEDQIREHGIEPADLDAHLKALAEEIRQECSQLIERIDSESNRLEGR